MLIIVFSSCSAIILVLHVTITLLSCIQCAPDPWFFKEGEFSREHKLPVNHKVTLMPVNFTGFRFYDGYLRGWNTSHYFTTEKIWWLKHSLPINNYTNVWETKEPTESYERWQNIKQLRRFTTDRGNERTFIDYIAQTIHKFDYDKITADSWAYQHDDYVKDKMVDDRGIYDSNYDNSFYTDPERDEDFGTADYLTKIYTQADPVKLFGAKNWDFPADKFYN